MKSHNLTEAVVFWRWTAPNNIAIVTGTAVYHWSIEGESPPQKVFDRHEKLLDSCQIINYQVNSGGWRRFRTTTAAVGRAVGCCDPCC